jgi:hypothetical protein
MKSYPVTAQGNCFCRSSQEPCERKMITIIPCERNANSTILIFVIPNYQFIGRKRSGSYFEVVSQPKSRQALVGRSDHQRNEFTMNSWLEDISASLTQQSHQVSAILGCHSRSWVMYFLLQSDNSPGKLTKDRPRRSTFNEETEQMIRPPEAIT